MRNQETLTLKLIRWTFIILFRTLARVVYTGREHVPPSGPFLMVTNHLSYVDPPLLLIGLQRTGMTGLAADTYKSSPFFRWLVEGVGGIWINRGGGDRAALKAALAALKEGKILGLAPEGRRSRETHALQPGKTGAAFIASKAGVPLVPVGLAGTEKVLSGLKRFRRPTIHFNIGPAFSLPPLDGREDKSQALDEYTHEIMCRIAVLLPEDYQGVYRGDPRIEELRAGQP